MSSRPTRSALAHAKLNLSLEIRGAGEDGMHLLDSVLCSISLADRVTVTARDDGEMTIDVPGSGAGSDTLNLALKAARLFQEEFGGSGYDIVLEKAIPAGAGMGGGSADAAAVLHLARALSGVDLPDRRLAELGAELGADIPFCVTGGLARVRGVGEQVEPLEMPDSLCDSFIVVAVPDFWLPTAEVYAAWDLAPQHGDADVVPRPIAGVVTRFVNDLEPAAESLVRQVQMLRRAMTEALGSPARLTGSGSALFGFATSRALADRVVRLISPQFQAVLVCQSVRRGVEIDA